MDREEAPKHRGPKEGGCREWVRLSKPREGQERSQNHNLKLMNSDCFLLLVLFLMLKDSFNSHDLVPSVHCSLKVPQTHQYVALFEMVGEKEVQILPARKQAN